jgi:small subunit ribosomal protein S1
MNKSVQPPLQESFEALLANSLGSSEALEGKVIKGTVIAIIKDMALIDVGLKSEGRISLKEFSEHGQNSQLKVGDVVDVYLERMEDQQGEVVLSHEKALREASWVVLEEAHKNNQHITGIIFGRVKGGFMVDILGATAFLPNSHIDVRPIRDLSGLMNVPQPFQILKMDRSRGNIVVSRRSILAASMAETMSELISTIQEGKILTGTVKNITEYGAFIDLGGIDGLLHITDIAWSRVTHPSNVLTVDQKIQVKVIRFHTETERISLGMKQLEEDPLANIDVRFPVGTKVNGLVTNITDYGAFVQLEKGVEGLVHVSEMSWTKRNFHPNKILEIGQQIQVKVLNIDSVKRRIGLGLKQCLENPWETFLKEHQVGDEIEGEIRNITDAGLFVSLNDNLDGMVRIADIAWETEEQTTQNYKKGDRVRTKILEIDPANERISLGIKQLSPDKFTEALSHLKKGSIVTVTVSAVLDNGIEVSVDENITGFIRRAELSRDRNEQRPDRFAIGEKVDAKITIIERNSRKIGLSIKAREIDEEKEALDEYGSTDSGASLGDILGAAITKAKERKAATTKTDETSEEVEEDSAKTEKDSEMKEEFSPVEEKKPKKTKKAEKAWLVEE